MKRRIKNKSHPVPDGKSPQGKAGTPSKPSPRLVIGICVLLATLTLIVFSRTFQYGFVNYDDAIYVLENPAIQKGLTLDGVGWAFTHTVAANRHPLTVLSLMLDYQLHGLNANGYHITNVLLHAVAAILLFLALKDLTGALWRSAFVAAVFAIHPLRVESVAWIAERKDALSGVFFMLTLWAYARYTSRPFSVGNYLLVALFLALGLMCKPILVTFPFVLLLLDYWPLKRGAKWGSEQRPPSVFWKLFLEKIPLLVISAAGCVVALLAQQNAVAPIAAVSLSLRLGNALLSYVIYLGQMFCPISLAVFYPLPAHLPFWEIAGSLVILLLISAGVFLSRRRYLVIGWLWYLGMLVPVIGLVQVGTQAHADRYTYLPQIGLYLALAWAATDLLSRWRYRGPALGILAVIVIGIFSVISFGQTAYWRDSESLWQHTLACTTNNSVAHNNLGMAYMTEGKVNDAIEQYQQAMEVDPAYALVHFNLGAALGQSGQMDSAIGEYQKAIALQPDYFQARNNLADAFLQTGHTDLAIAQLQAALKGSPRSAITHNNLGFIFLRTGQARAAIAEFSKTLEIDPDNLDACHYLAWVLATCPLAQVRDSAKAVELANKASQLSGDKDPEILSILAAAYANAGDFSQATAIAQQALALATSKGDNATASVLQSEMTLYRGNFPVRDTSLTNTLPATVTP